MIVLNGEASDLRGGDTLVSVLARLRVDPGARGIAVAVDGEVLPRSRWATFVLPEDARIEVLTAMQGG